jgi:hypothetical protein
MVPPGASGQTNRIHPARTPLTADNAAAAACWLNRRRPSRGLGSAEPADKHSTSLIGVIGSCAHGIH